MRSFVNLRSVPKIDLRGMISEATRAKIERGFVEKAKPDKQLALKDRIVALIFEKPSTRTRVSFDVGIRQMGGTSMILRSSDLQLTNGEDICDTARVLSRYVDMIIFRTFDEKRLVELAQGSSVPVINGLTDRSHPCQVMADIMTFEESKGSIAGKKVVWVGDGNNVCYSYIQAAAKFGFELAIACPSQFCPDKLSLDISRDDGAVIKLWQNPLEAAKNADLVVTDTYISMHDDKSSAQNRVEVFKGYQVNADLMAKAKDNALFLHCLPAHRDIEVTSEVLDGPQSMVFDAAENRLHIQKSIMRWCLSN